MKINPQFAFAMVFVLFFGSITWQISRYNECRTFGHSVGYCIGEVVR